MVIAAIFAASLAVACSLPVDVKIQKVASNSKLTPADAVMSARLRSQLRTAFSCRDEKNTAREVGREVVNVELVEIIHQGYSTRVNVATDRGFFSEKVTNYGLSHREKLEATLKLVADSISETVCK
ncbi:MAG: hypothetical protein ACD_50C00184G0002 [uncultured bacterium]|nr:MAG: hypothetical protein ACD_50C00184G0002 [uncultured bacterium]